MIDCRIFGIFPAIFAAPGGFILQADVLNGVLGIGNKGQSWMNKKQKERGMWLLFSILRLDRAS